MICKRFSLRSRSKRGGTRRVESRMPWNSSEHWLLFFSDGVEARYGRPSPDRGGRGQQYLGPAAAREPANAPATSRLRRR